MMPHIVKTENARWAVDRVTFKVHCTGDLRRADPKAPPNPEWSWRPMETALRSKRPYWYKTEYAEAEKILAEQLGISEGSAV